MAKISLLPVLATANVDGTETLPVLKGGAMVRTPAQPLIEKIAKPYVDQAKAAAEQMLIANYDPYFAPFLDAAVDGAGLVIEGTDYRGTAYAHPLKSWAEPNRPGPNYEAWTENGLLWVRSFLTGKTWLRTTTPAHIRNVTISPDETSIFFEQYVGLKSRWRRMHIRIAGTWIAAPRLSTSDILCVGDSITNGTGAEIGGTAGAAIPNSFNAGNGYPQALWLDPDIRAAGIEVYNFAFSGATSPTIADNVIALADSDPRLNCTLIWCAGRNDTDRTHPLIQLKRVKQKLKPYNVRIFGMDVPYRRGANRIGDPRRANIDYMNASQQDFLGSDCWIKSSAHMIDPGPNGALAVAIARGDMANGAPILAPSQQDQIDLEQGVPPLSLMYAGDGADVHPADAGHKANKDCVKAKLVETGGYL